MEEIESRNNRHMNSSNNNSNNTSTNRIYIINKTLESTFLCVCSRIDSRVSFSLSSFRDDAERKKNENKMIFSHGSKAVYMWHP